MPNAPAIPHGAPVTPDSANGSGSPLAEVSPAENQLTKDIGNASVAHRLLEIDHGVLPADRAEAAVLLDINKTAEDKAFKRWLNLQKSMGNKIANARAAYVKARNRTGVLFKAATGVSIEPDGTNVDPESGS